ncbi:MAG: ABC transporter permease [Patescibacteria group bacterium]|nr:ABC transporter permease [Patescibacteria group bacterium]
MHEILTSIKLALRSLRSNVGRTVFSLTGIVIGVAAVIIVLSLGAGVRGFVISQIEAFGSDIIEIEIKTPKTAQTSAQNIGGMVGGVQITTLKIEDAEEIAKLSNVGAWYGGIMSQDITSYKNKNKQVLTMGTTADVIQVDEKMEIEFGRMFTEEDDDGLKQVVVLGSGIKESFFGKEDAVGKNIKIRGKSFRVMGVLKERGAISFFDFDKLIYVPLKTLQKKVMGADHITFAMFKMKDEKKAELTTIQMNDIMRKQHDIDDPDDDDFAVMSMAEAKGILEQVFTVLNILLLSLTSISLVVGGAGIMNVMYVTVIERYFEIGLRKSVGARNSGILAQFLFEAIFLTLLGGIAGVIVGVLVSLGAEYAAFRMGYFLEFKVTLWSVMVALSFSSLTGVIFGIYPAIKAARLSPMDALRKE